MANNKKYLRSVNQVAKRSKKPAKKPAKKRRVSCPANGAKTYLSYKGKAYECCGAKGHVFCHVFDASRMNNSHAAALRLQAKMRKAAEAASADVAAELRDMRESMSVPGAEGASYGSYGRRSRRSRR